MSLTVGELRALIDGLDDSVEVRLATQPSYPFESAVASLKAVNPSQADIDHIRDVLSTGSLTADEVVEARENLEQLEAIPEILYICQGSQIGYASPDLWSY